MAPPARLFSRVVAANMRRCHAIAAAAVLSPLFRFRHFDYFILRLLLYFISLHFLHFASVIVIFIDADIVDIDIISRHY